MKTIDDVKKILRNAHDQLGLSWPEIERRTGVNRATACRIANKDYEPKSRSIRKKLGLPPMGTVMMCPTCGIVHVKRCPKTKKRRRNRDLFMIPVDELREMLENREDF